jgi:hypothetical protein
VAGIGRIDSEDVRSKAARKPLAQTVGEGGQGHESKMIPFRLWLSICWYVCGCCLANKMEELREMKPALERAWAKMGRRWEHD